MSTFKRNLPGIDELKEKPLFRDYLLPDIEKGLVFPAIRGGYICFYHKGSRLFKYQSGKFSTHVKFGFVPAQGDGNGEFMEGYLGKTPPIASFCGGYDTIKARAADHAKYAKPEAKGVSDLHRFSPFNKTRTEADCRYVLLDTEIAFNPKDIKTDADDADDPGQKHKQDRLDLVLYDTQDRRLLFCEAKHFSNGEFWNGEVEQQIARYNKQLQNKWEAILKQYGNYVDDMNALFGTDLPRPTGIQKECGLFLFGFNEEQKKRKDAFEKDEAGAYLGGIPYYPIGNPGGKKFRIATLWKNVKKSDIYGC